MVAGLATVTPASGFIGPMGGLILGLVSGVVCQWMTMFIKQNMKIDDSLDVFAVHGVGGIIGTLCVAFLATSTFQGLGLSDGATVGSQIWVQFIGVAAVAAWSAMATFIILKVSDALFGLRVPEEEEIEGLDITAHGERSYEL
jgi:Amt family ammonium transporter